MSDDTPTQRFTPGDAGAPGTPGDAAPTQRYTPGNDAPTQRMDAFGATQPGATQSGAPARSPLLDEPEKRRNRGLLITVIVLGVLLLAAIVVLLLSRMQAPVSAPAPTESATVTPTVTPTPTETPTEEPTETAAPEPTGPLGVFTTFSASPTTVTCSKGGPGTEAIASFPIQLSWTSTGAQQAYVGIDTDDASAAPYDEVGRNSQYEINFQCPEPQHVFTITLVDENGQTTSRSVTVRNNGDTSYDSE